MDIRPILLVEDDPRDLDLTIAALEQAGVKNRIRIARDGVEALDYLLCRGAFNEREPIDPCVVFLDLKMPKVNGLEVLDTIRADRRIGRLPVVLLTSSREERDVAHGYALGANAFIVKPIDFDEFAQTITGLGVFWTKRNEPPPRTSHEHAVGV